MTPAEAAALLTVAAAYDNRKPDADAAQAWALALDGLRFHDCRAVIVEHYRTSTDWIMPKHVIDAVKRLRDKRIALAGDLTPPADLTPVQTIAWLKDARRRIGDGETREEVEADYGELKERHLPDLRALLPKPTKHPEADEEGAA
jgi:hypothetical protein